ncbi:DODA-type extradiol aromatic ring-opening family dioxygenase [Rivibacter subsaxonicus]|uniref:4,5-DOPA dioxygenase extradiol n=1 Tax=Rivibacter subsaxonicus TaxID=457575 RepID=A0A4Q7W0P8_9BURK|nr:class III extradiol ring-cleavage dioxygenase [Rivibacter subsaxonicus]RZU02458.1 4,5-DOPA dioxygenase extradiol [Rivibacter subsaxonicus]
MSTANPLLPALFISHGSPMLAIEPGSTGAFLQRLGPAIDATFGRPRAIVVVSPHTSAPLPVVLGSAAHHAVHDFGGFPRELYALQYAPPGAPALADRAVALLAAAGIDNTRLDDEPGLDHGIWSVLRFAWPDADIPVLPIALAPRAATADQWALGAALAPLAAEGVLVLGSGSLTHNLGLVGRSAIQAAGDTPAGQELPQSRDFRDWVAERVQARDQAALLDYRAQAPHAALMHPSDEHWLPFYIAAGAGGLDATPARLHASVTYGSLAMDAYAFGPGAQALRAALVTSAAAGA